jgi:hypothetical protein
MADSSPNFPGQDQLAGDNRALMLELAAGEVLTAFDTATIMRDKHETKSLANGKNFRFPAIWRAGGGYHVPGTEITGRKIPHTEIKVDPDDKLISDVFVSDIDEILNHFDLRQPYTQEMGRFLARKFDSNVMRAILLAARGGALFSGDQGGSAIQDADFDTDAVKLIDGFSAAKQALDEKDVPIDSMPVHALLSPAQWYLIARSDKNLNRDVNGGTANIRSMTLETIDEIMIHKSNIAPFGEDSTAGDFIDDTKDAFIPSYYRGKFGTTVGMVWTPMAACSALVQDVSFQTEEQVRKQGDLMLARLMVGTRTLRNKCAVELRTGAIPA